MRAEVCPAGALLADMTSNDGCAEYRLLMPARPLIAQGADVVINQRGPVVLWSRKWEGLEPPSDVKVIGLAQRPETDVFVIQRPARRWWADLIPMLQKVGIKVVVDIDDLFDSLDKDHVGRRAFDPTHSAIHNHTWIDLACQRADTVTCTTPVLLERYGYGHGIILPNLIPERYLSVDVEKRFATLGWSGTVETHPADLQVTRGAVGEALDATGWGFHHIGTGKGIKEALGLSIEPSHTGWVPFAEYPERMAELSLGIVPLADTKFNAAKSALKMIEWASLGVPTLGTATPDNVRVQKLGIGAVVKHPGQWSRSLNRMIKDREYRSHVAGKGREVMSGLTYERKCHMWASAWGIS
jgi:hypothetical protein